MRQRVFNLLLLVLLAFGCSERAKEVGENVAKKIVPPSAPPEEAIKDPYDLEASLLETELAGIKFVRAVAPQDGTAFVGSSRTLREMLRSSSELKNQLRQKMPTLIWVDSKQPNYNFERFDADIIEPLIHLGKFNSAQELIDFLILLPDRSDPAVAKRIESQAILDMAAAGQGDFKFPIHVDRPEYSKSLHDLERVQRVLMKMSKPQQDRIRDVTVTAGESKFQAIGERLSISLHRNSAEHDWFEYLNSILQYRLSVDMALPQQMQ